MAASSFPADHPATAERKGRRKTIKAPAQYAGCDDEDVEDDEVAEFSSDHVPLDVNANLYKSRLEYDALPNHLKYNENYHNDQGFQLALQMQKDIDSETRDEPPFARRPEQYYETGQDRTGPGWNARATQHAKATRPRVNIPEKAIDLKSECSPGEPRPGTNPQATSKGIPEINLLDLQPYGDDSGKTLREVLCHDCGDALFATLSDVTGSVNSWLSNRSPNGCVVECGTCGVSVCCGCWGQNGCQPPPAKRKGKLRMTTRMQSGIMTTIPKWCCTNAQILVPWLILIYFDMEHNKQIRAAAQKPSKTERDLPPSGTGYSADFDVYEDGGFSGSDSDDMYTPHTYKHLPPPYHHPHPPRQADPSAAHLVGGNKQNVATSSPEAIPYLATKAPRDWPQGYRNLMFPPEQGEPSTAHLPAQSQKHAATLWAKSNRDVAAEASGDLQKPPKPRRYNNISAKEVHEKMNKANTSTLSQDSASSRSPLLRGVEPQHPSTATEYPSPWKYGYAPGQDPSSLVDPFGSSYAEHSDQALKEDYGTSTPGHPSFTAQDNTPKVKLPPPKPSVKLPSGKFNMSDDPNEVSLPPLGNFQTQGNRGYENPSVPPKTVPRASWGSTKLNWFSQKLHSSTLPPSAHQVSMWKTPVIPPSHIGLSPVSKVQHTSQEKAAEHLYLLDHSVPQHKFGDRNFRGHGLPDSVLPAHQRSRSADLPLPIQQGAPYPSASNEENIQYAFDMKAILIQEEQMFKEAEDAMRSKVSSKQTLPGPPSGTGYGGFDGYSGMYSRSNRAGGQGWPDIKEANTNQLAIDSRNVLTRQVFENLTELLPGLTKPMTVDRSMKPALSNLFLSSTCLDVAAEILRNDSLEDAATQAELYAATINFVAALAHHPDTNHLVLNERRAKKGSQLLVDTPLDRSKDVSESKDMVTSLHGSMTNLVKQCKVYARYESKKTDRASAKDKSHIQKTLLPLADRLDALKATDAIDQNAISPNRVQFSTTQHEWAQFHLDHAFDDVPDEVLLANHAFAETAKASTANTGKNIKRLITERANLSTSLPSGIFVRSAENRLDLLKALIIGPSNTPYAGGLFEFDLWCTDRYPAVPPKCTFKTTGGGRAHFNPNLYNDGKVCLSLLGTWSGERWRPGESTILQILVSLQAMVLCAEPWFNEPGREIGYEQQKEQSDRYNGEVRELTLRWALDDVLAKETKAQIYKTPTVWGDVLKRYINAKGKDLATQVQDWKIKPENGVVGQFFGRLQRWGYEGMPEDEGEKAKAEMLKENEAKKAVEAMASARVPGEDEYLFDAVD